ncbi:MAG TPA: CbiX/SirB N-terminal domain-containing protein [Thermoanaerobaculia bacterium]|nr:CbiX/SirB N-terminal domain-containing protein [Thermoanaerobaculia bacterium]
MKALLIMAHGSPRPEANEDILKIGAVIRARGLYDFVHVCYLDCNEPDIATGVDQCIEAGAIDVVAVPYFLHSGKHFLRDIPNILMSAARKHPMARITMGDYVGHMPELAEVLRDRVRATSS